MPPHTEPVQNVEALAAVDLGSNSFHMLVARVVDHEIHVVDDLKERVALAEGLDEQNFLVRDVRQRALACLERFGERVRPVPDPYVRAVGTNTLRAAKNSRDFLRQAERALGHPIEVIAGREEARLIYLGVFHTLGGTTERRLVVDIGGGSTECIIGEGAEPILADSLFMGCVSWSQRHFPDGEITAEGMRRAIIEAELEVRPIVRQYRKLGWRHAVGASGTINAVEQICLANRWTADGITPAGLKRLRRELIQQGHAADLDIEGMKPDRAPVIAGGVAVLSGVFEVLGIELMRASSGALREGLMYDLLGRIAHEDVRDRTIAQFSARYHIDEVQAARVRDTAERLLDGAEKGWDDVRGEFPRSLLRWAAALHEIGQSISYSGYHKHSAYLVANSDMPGFSRDDQQTLAAAVLSHRRKLRKKAFLALPAKRRRSAFRVCLLLRLSVLLNRHRSDEILPPVDLEIADRSLTLHFPDGWLEAHSLIRADLEHESEAVLGAEYDLHAL